MIFISLKVAMLVTVFKIAQGGSRKGVVGLGVSLAFFFALCAYVSFGFSVRMFMAELVLGLLLCPLVMSLYWKQDGVAPSMAVAGIGAAVLVIALPLLAGVCVEVLSGT